MFVPRQVQLSHPRAKPPPSKPAAPVAAVAPRPANAATHAAAPAPPQLALETAQAITLILEQLLTSENPHTPWVAARLRAHDAHPDCAPPAHPRLRRR